MTRERRDGGPRARAVTRRDAFLDLISGALLAKLADEAGDAADAVAELRENAARAAALADRLDARTAAAERGDVARAR